MIDRDEMMRLLLDACPSFRLEWDAFVSEWEDEQPDLPLYIALAAFVRHLMVVYKRGELEVLREVFPVVERLQVEGDEYVRNAAIVGILECLANWNMHGTTKPKQFIPFLGPASQAWWEEYGDFEESRPADD
jgi:hypothetical protein